MNKYISLTELLKQEAEIICKSYIKIRIWKGVNCKIKVSRNLSRRSEH